MSRRAARQLLSICQRASRRHDRSLGVPVTSEGSSGDEVRSTGLRLLTFPDFTQPNSREKLMKRIAAVIIVGLICSTLSIATSAQQSGEQAGAATPRWVLHVGELPRWHLERRARSPRRTRGDRRVRCRTNCPRPTSPSVCNPRYRQERQDERRQLPANAAKRNRGRLTTWMTPDRGRRR